MSSSTSPDLNYRQYEIHDGICFLIEITPDILTPIEELDGKSQLLEILSSINELVKELIIILPSTGIGIYFYNCEETNKKFPEASGLNKLFKLNDLNSYNMKKLHDVVNDMSKNEKYFEEAFPIKHLQNKDTTMPLVLHAMLGEFERKEGYFKRRLIWLTNSDEPYTKDETKKRLWRIVNDFDELQIRITPIFLDSYADKEHKVKKAFNLEKYQDIFLNTNYLRRNDKNTDNNEGESLPEVKSEHGAKSYFDLVYDGSSRRSAYLLKTTFSKKIHDSIMRLKDVNRIAFSCNLILSDSGSVAGSLGCSIRGYSIYSHEKLKRYRKLYTGGEALKLVHSSTKFFNERTGIQIEDLLLKQSEDGDTSQNTRIVKGFPLGGKDVLITNEQQMEILKNYIFDNNALNSSISSPLTTNETDEDDDLETNIITSPPYLKLLGFKSIDNFTPFFSYGYPTFITADLSDGLGSGISEGGYKNSFSVYSSLYQSCKKLEKYAVVFGCTSRNSTPCLFALYPTRVRGLNRVSPNFPEGFFLIKVPWLDDIRSVPEYISLSSTLMHSSRESPLPIHLVQNLKHVISQFFLKEYNPSEFPNPSLNYFYKVMTKELLQEEMTEAEREILNNDVTAVKLQNLKEFLHSNIDLLSSISSFNSSINKLGVDFGQGKSDTGPNKKPKVAVPPLDEAAVLTAWKTNTWEYFTVAQLKDFIRNYKGLIKLATKKQDLINNIVSYLSQKNRDQK